MAVTPKCQGKGISDKLLRHCFESADRDRLPTWLSAFPGSRDFCLKLGFVEVEYADLDLNAWDKFRYRGYGIYRGYTMVRQPREISETEG
jgi:N-acetylglutamate synthase-like GNAT family acetyltransferase